MPMVMPIYWGTVVSPEARPCTVSGRPAVAVTLNPTMAARLAMPPMNVAAGTMTSETSWWTQGRANFTNGEP